MPLTKVEMDALFENLSMLDLTKYPSALDKRPVHFWHGMKDEVVPYKPTRSFMNQFLDNYSDVPERLSFTIDKKLTRRNERCDVRSGGELASHLNE